MGNDCFKFKRKETNDTIINDSGSLLKKVNECEYLFWEEIDRLRFTNISKFFKSKSKRTVEFGFCNLFVENFMTFGQIMEYLVTEQNFFYFTTVYEITIAILDFLQVVFTLKKKYGLNKNNFFFINFERFYLMKDDEGFYSKLIYLDEKLNDAYTCPELLYRDDNNLLSSFSMIEENGRSAQFLLSTMNSTNFKTTMSLDLNSYFYSKCNDRYQAMRGNYSLEECETFYTENVLNFVSRFLIKKVTITQQDLEHDFNNLKYILRYTLNHFFKSKENLTLQNLKMILTNFYVNNFEYGVFRDALEEKLNSNNSTSSNQNLMEKIIAFKRAGISLLYGECDIVSDSIPRQFHKIAFIHDNIVASCENTSGNTNSVSNGNSAPSICINCASGIISKKSPDGRSNFVPLNKFEEELIKKHSFIDLVHVLKYMCSYFESDNNTKKILLDKGEDIQIYRKNKHCVTFEYIEWDEYRECALQNQILNLDFYVKNNVKKRKSDYQNDKSIILPKP